METKNIKKYCLFSGRHELPENEGPLFLDFDFQKFQPLASEKYFEALEELEKGNSVAVFVTGLTPALTHFLSEVRELRGRVVLLHYNSQKKEYVKQIF